MRIPYTLERLGVVMRGDPNDPHTEWGVLNPGSARRSDGTLLLFPRLVARGNISRIGQARVIVDRDGLPLGTEPASIVLAPDETWERHPGGGGVEDPRISRVDKLGLWVMAYTAYGPLGPRAALAVSADLDSWDRLGPITYAYDPALGVDLNLCSNKDAAVFPEAVPAPNGEPAIAIMHRPTWDLDPIHPGVCQPLPKGLLDPRPGIWVSFVELADVRRDRASLTHLAQHRLVALPEQPWEILKIGAGTPPVRVPEGWLVLHHGVSGRLLPELDHQPYLRYSAGALLLDTTDVTRVVARSADPLLEPQAEGEREGIVPNVVFPTAIEVDEHGGGIVFYGMADSRIGAARLSRQTGPP
ncbi:MAG: glycosidase [Chloroflexi bacterium]|nr:glycosidase [Chloroflexota bacterium]